MTNQPIPDFIHKLVETIRLTQRQIEIAMFACVAGNLGELGIGSWLT